MGKRSARGGQITRYQDRTVDILGAPNSSICRLIAAWLLPAYWLQLMVC
jgi:hypothetical protein